VSDNRNYRNYRDYRNLRNHRNVDGLLTILISEQERP
jgi:hypothetical protein